jgi:hypothetical protein
MLIVPLLAINRLRLLARRTLAGFSVPHLAIRGLWLLARRTLAVYIVPLLAIRGFLAAHCTVAAMIVPCLAIGVLGTTSQGCVLAFAFNLVPELASGWSWFITLTDRTFRFAFAVFPVPVFALRLAVLAPRAPTPAMSRVPAISAAILLQTLRLALRLTWSSLSWLTTCAVLPVPHLTCRIIVLAPHTQTLASIRVPAFLAAVLFVTFVDF